MARYDEDLHENLFFQMLVGKYSSLFNEAADNRWLICVPRFDTVSRLKLSKTDFENHILKPTAGDELKDFVSINGKQVVIDGDVIKAGKGYREIRTVKILFEECFFNSREESYQVFCLEQPLEGALSDDVAVVSLENLDECSKFLWSDQGSEKVKKSVDRLLEIFQIERGTGIRPIMDAASAVYTRAVQEVFKLRKFHGASQKNFCKLAVETYVMAGLQKKIFKEVCFHHAHKDAEMNKITRNLLDTHPQYLGIKAQFWLIIPKAKGILSQLNQFASPLEKLCCFKECISVLTELPMEGTYEAMTADELLPLLVFLVIVCDIPNWNGNLTYISKFHFSKVGMDEFAYFLTSFEAAVEYVYSEAKHLASMSSHIDKAAVEKFRSSSSVPDDESSSINQFFKVVCEGDVSAVVSLLDKAQEEVEAAKAQLCHPLCNCEKCTALENSQLDDADKVTVYSRDGDGRTGLHHAARMGHSEVVHLLLVRGAIVGATDHHSSTPLHLACQKGYQACVLLLLGEDTIINAHDNAGNTPLHLACSNGHEECVMALLFQPRLCNINAVNVQGDTPLHNAARWGYANIVSLLLEHGASSNIPNRRREVAAQSAQSRKVQELLSGTKKMLRAHSKEEGQTVRTRVPHKRTDSLSESDRQLKKLFRAIQDNDINYVLYLFGWSEAKSPSTAPDLCHPLCQCERCAKIRKTPAMTGGLTVNSCDSHGHTPLHRAALQGNRKMVELLLKHGAAIDFKTRDHQLTPLHLACQYNHKDVVLVMLESRAEVNPQDEQGNTPLHFTCSNGHIESATILLIHGADVSVANNRGDTPLHSAARWNHPMLVNELMLYGALYSVTNNDNKMPVELTKDEEVSTIIHRAQQGEIAVGSYRVPPTKPGQDYSPCVRIHRVGESPRAIRHTPDDKLDTLLRQIESFGRQPSLLPPDFPQTTPGLPPDFPQTTPGLPRAITPEQEYCDMLYSDNFDVL